METLSVAIIGDHLRMHYGSLSVFYLKESREFKQAMKVIEKRNEQKLDLSKFQTVLFLEEDFEEDKLGIKLQKVNGKEIKLQKELKPVLSEPLKEKITKEEIIKEEIVKEKVIETIEEEKEKVDEKDRGVLELTKAIIDTNVDDDEEPEELLHKEIEELTKPVEKETFFGKMFGKIKSLAGTTK